ESFRLACGYTKWDIVGEIYALGMYPKDAVATGGQKYMEEAYELGKRL
ncbi:MAG TPA: flavodoxin family protein, partial [Candidatus Caccocola faecipullorum]|nr:flavodoxin family protein [Candidatus Caccocola faecipullorum]